MAVKLSITLPGDLYEEIKMLAGQQGTTVSGWFAELARQYLDDDRRSRAVLAERIRHDRVADPEGHAEMAADLRKRMRDAQEAARRRAAGAA
ncbi:ribbon-helix-helix domain-containing protein [Planomonospora parontospora]|uniref:ribbon-helix-helix domain-containing protein n=1 Tax=Planomonospora parontospora TaxID=58119 RepID=UPI00166F7EF3|nr:hypothetical protein [Planomonospora parontospora]GGL47360.1 hypothetical protein GCM10014719_55860 [Planomonospora parontospora subsp. antibiotica]GII19875.1 hypothetical protein Ppa05_66010 [Planomonospora parontospora subsp. antibiotica]